MKRRRRRRSQALLNPPVIEFEYVVGNEMPKFRHLLPQGRNLRFKRADAIRIIQLAARKLRHLLAMAGGNRKKRDDDN